MAQRMQLGFNLPISDTGGDPATVKTLAQTAEGLGYDYLAVPDHASRPNWGARNTSADCFHDPFVLFGYLASCTQSIGFSTEVMIIAQRQAALMAKQAASLDVLCGGRFRFGVGVGWNEVEFVALNEGFKNRARRLEEQFEVLRALWTNELLTFEGKYHTIKDAGINPLPVQQPIPLWIGAFEDVAVERACRIADGWFTKPWMLPDDEGKQVLDQVRGWLGKHGRDPAKFAINSVTLAKNGSVNQWVADTEAWREQGISHCTFRTIDAPFDTIDQHLAACRAYAEAIGLNG